VLKEKADSWHHGVSPSSHQAQLDSLLAALKALANSRLSAGCVLANLHHRWIIPLMERPLHIFEMHEEADPVALAQSRLLPDLFMREYAATRARRTIDLRAARNDDEALWAFTLLAVGPLVSGLPPPLALLVRGVLACFEALPIPCRWRSWMPRGPTHPRPAPGRARRSGGSKSGWCAGGRGGSGGVSAGSGETRSFGCASSRDSLLRRHRKIRRRRRRRWKTGDGLSLIGGSPRPHHRETQRR
jgi:hypothetical protein